MSPTDHDALSRTRHDMNTPLTVIKGQAQLAARQVERCPSIPDDERERLLARLSIIGSAAEALARQVAALRGADGDAVARPMQVRE